MIGVAHAVIAPGQNHQLLGGAAAAEDFYGVGEGDNLVPFAVEKQKVVDPVNLAGNIELQAGM